MAEKTPWEPKVGERVILTRTFQRPDVIVEKGTEVTVCEVNKDRGHGFKTDGGKRFVDCGWDCFKPIKGGEAEPPSTDSFMSTISQGQMPAIQEMASDQFKESLDKIGSSVDHDLAFMGTYYHDQSRLRKILEMIECDHSEKKLELAFRFLDTEDGSVTFYSLPIVSPEYPLLIKALDAISDLLKYQYQSIEEKKEAIESKYAQIRELLESEK